MNSSADGLIDGSLVKKFDLMCVHKTSVLDNIDLSK